MAWKKRKKDNRIKSDVIDVEARVIPEEPEIVREEPRFTETEELKLNQEIVSDILKESAEQSFEDAGDLAQTVLEDADKAFEEAFTKAEETVEPVVEEIKETAEQAAETVTEVADQAEEAFGEVVEQAENTVEEIREEVSEAAEAAEETVTEAAAPVIEEISEIAEEAAEQAEEAVSETVEEAVDKAEEISEEISEAAETAEEDLTEAAVPVMEAIREETEETVVPFAEPENTDSLTIADPGVTKEVSTFDGESMGKSDTMAKSKKEKKAKKVKVKKDRLGFNWFFWLSFIVLLVPVCFFAYLLYTAAQETHTPIIGERINSEIIHMIDDDQKAAVETRLKGIEGVENCAVNLIVETMRIELDVRDDMTAEEMDELAKQAYEAVNEIIPVETYFTQQSDYKQYDLEIYVYDNLKLDEFRLVLINKNSNMEEYLLQTLTTPKNAEVAAELAERKEEEKREREEEEAEENGEVEQETEGETEGEPTEMHMPADDTTGE